MPAAISATEIPGLAMSARGKVRDIYDLGDRLLIVATDRISAFDSVLGSPIPDKGRVLTQLSLFWFNILEDVVANHLLTTDLASLNLAAGIAQQLAGRSMIVRKAEPLPVECVVRGYLIGSGWKEYQASGKVCGIPLPAGMKLAQQLDQPIFTPATKAQSGHDENICFSRAGEILGEDVAARVREASIALYSRAAAHACSRGVIIADTKFEFGLVGGELILIDEVLTPDSSRFWPAESYQMGVSPPSYDKQFVRDWLESESGWDKEPPAPALPEAVVARTRAKYLEAYQALTGSPLPGSA